VGVAGKLSVRDIAIRKPQHLLGNNTDLGVMYTMVLKKLDTENMGSNSIAAKHTTARRTGHNSFAV
jgi:hypothetical protein